MALRRAVDAWALTALRPAVRGVLLASLFCLPLPLGAHCVTRAEWTRIDLAGRLGVLRDPSGAMTLDAARAAQAAGRFAPNRATIPAFGFTPDAIWLHVPVCPGITRSERIVVELCSSRLDAVDWYVVRNGQFTQHAAMGLLQAPPTGQRTRYPLLALAVHPGEDLDLFVRVQSVMTLVLPVTAWRTEAYAAMAARREAAEGLYFGYLLALIVTGMVFAAFARDRGYLTYSLVS